MGLKRLCSSEINLAEFVDSNDYSFLDFQTSNNITEIESVLEDLQEEYLIKQIDIYQKMREEY